MTSSLSPTAAADMARFLNRLRDLVLHETAASIQQAHTPGLRSPETEQRTLVSCLLQDQAKRILAAGQGQVAALINELAHAETRLLFSINPTS